jgi:hypothetical protein
MAYATLFYHIDILVLQLIYMEHMGNHDIEIDMYVHHSLIIDHRYHHIEALLQYMIYAAI